jgi:uncharacterized RDD family membrane protein YckC
MKTNTLHIRTPEGIVFALPLAGPVTRFFAWLVDIACLGVVSQLLGSAIRMFGWISEDWAVAFAILLFFVAQVGYGIACEWLWRGQTLGKRLLRLRVMDAQGLQLQFSQVVIRNLLRAVDGLPGAYLVGGIACLVSQRAQRLGDLAANTIVVRLAQPHLEARLRQRVSPAEATTALQALVRRDELDPAARVQLFAELAAHFKSLVEFPPESVEGIADEQYVRNVVDVLFRPRGKAAPPVPPALASR